MKKNYKLLATLVLSGLAGAAFGVLPAEAAVTVGPVDGTEKPLTNTEFTSLYGNTYTGSTSGNTVSISGEGTVTLNTLAGAYTLESGDASNNKLSVTDGASVSFSNATNNWIAGGRSMKGAASGNQVTLSGVSLNLPDATPSSLKIAGGETESGNADGNTVTLDTITSSGIVYGGRVGNGNNVVATVNMSVLPVSAEESTETDTSTEADPISTSASSNSVTITGSQVEGVYGGYMQYYGDTSAEADAVAGVNHNTVTLTNSTAQSSDIYGGYMQYYRDTSAEADAVAGVNHNTVTLTNSTAQSSDIYGGYMQYYRDTSAEADAVAGVNHNTVTLTNSTAQSSYIYGGYMKYYGDTSAEADAGVNHNTVTLTNTSASGTSVYGGYVSSSSAPALNASSNTVEISNTAEKKYGVSTVTGGYTEYGDANDNTVKITGTKGTDDDEIYLTSVSSDITGGETESGNADGNTVTLDTITSSGIVYGGRAGNGNDVAVTVLMSVLPVSAEESTETDTSASSNSVTITGSQVEGVYGGVGQIGSAKGNIVTITDSSVEMEAVGGETGYMMNWITQPGQLKDAENNQVIVNGSSTIGTVVGGEAAAANTSDEKYGEVQTSGKSSGNTVTINDGTVKKSVLGGHSAMSDAIGNTVNIAGGIIGTESSGTGEADDNAIAGGFAKEGQANNNTVNITGGTLGAMMSLYGGYSEKGSSSNTLNLHTKGNTVKNLGYFQNLNFYVPEGTAAGETMVTVTGNADVSKAVIQAGIEKTTKLAPGQAINLIYDAGGIKTDGTSYSMMSGKDIVSDAGFVDRKAAVKKQDDNTIVVYVPKDEKGTIHPDTKIIPEDRENGINTIKNAGDLVSNAAEGAWKEDHDVDAKFVPYAIVGGYDLHYNTGSYIDSNGMAANVGLIRRIRRDGAIDTVMPFLEYGRSNYASFLDDGARGDGRQHYTGGGVLLRRDLDDGKYYEGAIRAGRLKGDFHGIIDSTALRYDSSAPYVAAQAGAGKIYAKDRDTYDLYGKFFWTHLGSDTATIRNSRGEAKYEFDDINSYRTRLGMRWTRNFDKVRSLYAGIGWDYEFDSKARAFYDAYRTDTPTVKGSSEFLELGWKSKVTSDHPWGVDLKATGWTGKQEGGTLFATVSRSF